MLDVPASTLRAWEERYSVVTPSRSGGAQRLYSRTQVEQLRFVKAQMDSGASAADAHRLLAQELAASRIPAAPPEREAGVRRSGEHSSEHQSPPQLLCRLLLDE